MTLRHLLGRRLAPRALAAVVVLFAEVSPAQAQAPGDDAARRQFADGVALEKQGDYAAALAKFRESARNKATLGNRFHTAYCLEMIGRLAAALREYEAVDRTAREQKKPELLEATRLRLEPLRGRVPELSVRVAPEVADVQIMIDDAPLEATVLDGRKFRADPGEHVITGRAPQRRPFSRSVTLVEGAAASVDVVFESDVEPVRAPEREKLREAPARPASSFPTLALAATIGAAATLGASAFAFVTAGNAQDDALASCPTQRSCSDEQSKVRTLDALALGGFAVTAGLTALSIVLWTTRSPSSTTAVVTRPSWIGVEGRF